LRLRRYGGHPSLVTEARWPAEPKADEGGPLLREARVQPPELLSSDQSYLFLVHGLREQQKGR